MECIPAGGVKVGGPRPVSVRVVVRSAGFPWAGEAIGIESIAEPVNGVESHVHAASVGGKSLMAGVVGLAEEDASVVGDSREFPAVDREKVEDVEHARAGGVDGFDVDASSRREEVEEAGSGGVEVGFWVPHGLESP